MKNNWVPKLNETVYCINVYAPNGYDKRWYKDVMKIALDRRMIFKKKEEALERVREIGW